MKISNQKKKNWQMCFQATILQTLDFHVLIGKRVFGFKQQIRHHLSVKGGERALRTGLWLDSRLFLGRILGSPLPAQN